MIAYNKNIAIGPDVQTRKLLEYYLRKFHAFQCIWRIENVLQLAQKCIAIHLLKIFYSQEAALT